MDWPACSFYKQLMAAYPAAKVVLGVRDPEKWYRSAKATIYSMIDVSCALVPPSRACCCCCCSLLL